jgi:hypothetical protein
MFVVISRSSFRLAETGLKTGQAFLRTHHLTKLRSLHDQRLPGNSKPFPEDIPSQRFSC